MNRPILFNGEMVKAIREGRKTQTRRVCKGYGDCNPVQVGYHPPFKPGDILWVREAWHKDAGRYMYRANYNKDEKFYRNGREVEIRWKPSIHMPKEAARLFLRVKDVRVERLQEITVLDAINEGCSGTICDHKYATHTYGCIDCHNTGWLEAPDAEFAQLWDTTIKPTDRDKYGWDANPWVWVIEFESCEKPEGWDTRNG